MIIKELKELGEVSKVILGFPGTGMVGSISAEFIIHKLGFEEVGHIRSDKLPAIAIIRKSRPEAPIRLYKQGDILMLVSDVMVPDDLAHEFAGDMGEWIEAKSPEEVIVLGGTKKQKGEEVYVVSWKDRYLDEVELEHMKLGFVVGVYGPLMMEFMERGLEGYLVLAEAEHKPDPAAAARVIRHLSGRLGIEVDPTPLEKEAARKADGEKVSGQQQTWDPYPSIYG